MTTLYDLLGALPGDDADDLRSAFREAVKGVHPDIRPNDPDAALNFRLIIHAMDVLRDPDQRAAYDHLLELARQELVSQRRAAKLRNFAFAMIGLAGVSVAGVGAYVLFMPISAWPLHLRQIVDLSRGWADIASSSHSAPPPLNDNGATASDDGKTTQPAETQDDFLTRWGTNDSAVKADREAATAKATETPIDLPPRSNANDNRAPASGDAETATPAEARETRQPPSTPDNNDAPADREAGSATVMKEQETPIVGPSATKLPTPHDDADDTEYHIEPYDKTDPSAVMHARGIVAYRKGDLNAALADLNRAIELNPTFMLAYVNRGIVLYRMGKLDLALADVARARRIDRAGRDNSAAAFHRRRHNASLTESLALMHEAGP